jgi:hypothetical protein
MEQRRDIDPFLQAHIEKEEGQLRELREDIKNLQLEMTAFTEAWQQAKGVVQFVKWLVGISSGLAAFVLFIKDHIK